MDKKDLQKLSKVAYEKDGTFRSFERQLLYFAAGEMKTGDLFIVSEKTKLPFDVKYNELPLVVDQRIVKKIMTKHQTSLDSLAEFPKFIRTSPLAFKSKYEHLITVLPKQRDKEHLISVIKQNKYNKVLKINDIRSSYFTNIEKKFKNSIEHNMKIYTNDLTKKWLSAGGASWSPGSDNQYIISIQEYLEIAKQKDLILHTNNKSTHNQSYQSPNRAELPKSYQPGNYKPNPNNNFANNKPKGLQL